ncbi:MAG: DUF2490 domain-containing protein [Gammaproteobacteria bacterium]
MAVCAGAQEDFHSWGAVLVTGAIGDRSAGLNYWLEGQGRFNDDSSRLNQGIVRGALGKSVGARAVLWGGYAFIPTHPVGAANDTVEHRVWQQLTWQAPGALAGFSLTTRSRLEQRFVDSGDDTGWRARQLIKVTRPLGTVERLYVSIWNEVFVNLNRTDWGADDGFDQNRIFAGLGIRLAPGWVTEIGYMNQYVARVGRSDASNHVLSMTLFLNF